MPWADDLSGAVTDMLGSHGQSVVLERGGSVLDAQTFVLDWYGLRAEERASIEAAAGESGGLAVRLHGAADADVERGDQFVAGAVSYRVVLSPPSDGAQRIVYAYGREF